MIATGKLGHLIGHLSRCPSTKRRSNPTPTVNFIRRSTFWNFSQWFSLQHKSILVFSRKIGSSTSGVDKDCFKGKLDDYPEQKVTIYSCENVYKKWKKEKKFFSVPATGVYTDITFVDTMKNKDGISSRIKPDSPTVLCIHGIPGNYNVFNHLIKDFGKQGVRAIVPNFPDVLYLKGKEKDQLFRHSVEEKTQIFKDFLEALNVSRVDCIVAHSSAIYPALRLALDPSLNVKCQILFNTGGHRKTNTMKPYPVVWTCSYLFLHPLGRKFIMKTGKFIMKHILRSPIKDDNMYGIMLLAITMVFSECTKMKDLFYKLVEQELPTLLCFSEDDKVVERSLTYDVISLLGVSRENINYFDCDAQLKSEGKDKSWLRILSFEKGSHYVFRKHPAICNKEVFDIMNKHIPGFRYDAGQSEDLFQSCKSVEASGLCNAGETFSKQQSPETSRI